MGSIVMLYEKIHSSITFHIPKRLFVCQFETFGKFIHQSYHIFCYILYIHIIQRIYITIIFNK